MDRPEDPGATLCLVRPCPVRDCRRAHPFGEARLIPSRAGGARGGLHRRGRPSFCRAALGRVDGSVRTFCPAAGFARLRGQAQVAVASFGFEARRGMCSRRGYPANRRQHRG